MESEAPQFLPTFTHSFCRGAIILREALPSEYLARLLLHNRVFEDAISLEGILVGESEISLVVSQPDISGMPASLDEISTAMAGLGFEKIPGLHLGYPQSDRKSVV